MRLGFPVCIGWTGKGIVGTMLAKSFYGGKKP
jgi:hypothetical protein